MGGLTPSTKTNKNINPKPKRAAHVLGSEVLRGDQHERLPLPHLLLLDDGEQVRVRLLQGRVQRRRPRAGLAGDAAVWVLVVVCGWCLLSSLLLGSAIVVARRAVDSFACGHVGMCVGTLYGGWGGSVRVWVRKCMYVDVCTSCVSCVWRQAAACRDAIISIRSGLGCIYYVVRPHTPTRT